jgi:purine-binding chemotaxis protein CheW
MGERREARAASNVSASRGSGAGTGKSSPRGARAAHLCVFRIAGARFAIDARGVGEVVSVSSIVSVPVTSSAIVGIFNLRGHPLALVDLAELLGFESALQKGPSPSDAATVVMILRSDDLTAGARIDAMESVIDVGRAVEVRKAVDGDALIEGYLDGVAGAGVITVLSTDAVFDRVRNLRSR